jgi:hypothetical protein
MDKIEKAKNLFLQLESRKQGVVEIAKRNFEIQSRLAQNKF